MNGVHEEQWFVSPYSPAAREVREMFGEAGNFEDYWLGPGHKPPADEGVWVSAETFLRALRTQEREAWTPERDALEQLTAEAPNALDRGANLVGLEPVYGAVKSGLMKLGEFQESLDGHRPRRHVTGH